MGAPVRGVIWILAGLMLLTALAMGRVVGNGFTSFDDGSTLYGNPDFAGTGKTGAPWSYWNPAAPKAGLWVPVTYTVWYAVAQVAHREFPNELGLRLDAAPFHWASLLAHVASTAVVFALIWRLLGGASGLEARRTMVPAWIGAAVFAVHPLQVEAVGWTSGLKDVLGGMFVLGAVYCHVRWADGSAGDVTDKRQAEWQATRWIGVGLYVLAVLSKPSALMGPALAGVLLVGVRGWEWRRAVKSLWAWWLVVPLVVIWSKYAQPGTGVVTLAWPLRPLIAGDALAFYMGKMLWPVDLGFDYGRIPGAVRVSGALWWSWVVPAAVAAVLWWKRREWPIPVTGGVWTATALLPVLGLTPFMFQHFSTTADHYLYVAMAGIGMTAAWAVSRVGEERSRTAYALAGVVLCFWTVLSAQQMGYWKDSDSLYRRGLAVNPSSYLARTYLARDLLERYSRRQGDLGTVARALELLDASIAINPNYNPTWDERATALVHLGRYGEAVASMEKALEVGERIPPEIRGPTIKAHVMLGQFYLSRGVMDRAQREAKAARLELERGRSVLPEDAGLIEGLEQAIKAKGG